MVRVVGVNLVPRLRLLLLRVPLALQGRQQQAHAGEVGVVEQWQDAGDQLHRLLLGDDDHGLDPEHDREVDLPDVERAAVVAGGEHQDSFSHPWTGQRL